MRDDITIRQATVADADGFLGLVEEFARYVEMAPPDSDAKDRLVAHALGEQPLCHILLAEAQGAPGPVAYALYFFTYSSFLARPTLYLEDLFVLSEHRKMGIGGMLLRRCIRAAREQECGRMEWSCLHRDTRAHAFYDSLGARRIQETFTYRLTTDDLERLDG